MVSIFDNDAVERLRKQLQLDPQCVRVLRNQLLKKFVADDVALDDFPAGEQIDCHTLSMYRRHDSDVDGASRLLFKTASGMLIESVILRIRSGRNTLCVSSQVGCAAACDFCATGTMGIAQNLSDAEILDQVLQAGQILAEEDARLKNIVFMGMGEPFHNEAELTAAVESLTSPRLFDRSPAGILVSTVGIPDSMIRFAERFPAVNLALSLHSAVQTVRESIIPLAKKHPLDELRLTIEHVNQIQNRELMIEYLMLRDLNDSLDDAHQLLDWLRGLDVHVNLIPFNPIEDSPHLKCSNRSQINEFANTLKATGLKTTIRYSLGSDIAAACGQLVRKENRAYAMGAGATDEIA